MPGGSLSWWNPERAKLETFEYEDRQVRVKPDPAARAPSPATDSKPSGFTIRAVIIVLVVLLLMAALAFALWPRKKQPDDSESQRFKKAVTEAKLVILEPIMSVEVKVSEEYMGDVMGDLSGRRGKIQGMDPQGKFNVIRAQVPLAELYRYSTHLRSMTQGRGTHKREFSHYEEAPHDVAQKIIEEAKKEKEQQS